MDSESYQQDVTQEDRIGKGSFSKVYKGKWNGTTCAIKKFKRKDIPAEKAYQFISHELNIWQNLRHPNIVLLYEVYEGELPVIILELMETNLATYLQKFSSNRKELPLVNVVSILNQIILALIYLHKRKLIHGDLTANNILLSIIDCDLVAKISDFGMARGLNECCHDITGSSPCRTFYMPPEATDKISTVKLDIFSLGILVIHCVICKLPKALNATKEVDSKLVALTEFERYEPHLKEFNKYEKMLFENIVKQCLQNNPEKRPSVSDLKTILDKNTSDLKDQGFDFSRPIKSHQAPITVYNYNTIRDTTINQSQLAVGCGKEANPQETASDIEPCLLAVADQDVSAAVTTDSTAGKLKSIPSSSSIKLEDNSDVFTHDAHFDQIEYSSSYSDYSRPEEKSGFYWKNSSSLKYPELALSAYSSDDIPVRGSRRHSHVTPFSGSTNDSNSEVFVPLGHPDRLLQSNLSRSDPYYSRSMHSSGERYLGTYAGINDNLERSEKLDLCLLFSLTTSKYQPDEQKMNIMEQMATSQFACQEMKRSGCINLLLEIIYNWDREEDFSHLAIRERAYIMLVHLVNAENDPRQRECEENILSDLEIIMDYVCDMLKVLHHLKVGREIGIYFDERMFFHHLNNLSVKSCTKAYQPILFSLGVLQALMEVLVISCKLAKHFNVHPCSYISSLLPAPAVIALILQVLVSLIGHAKDAKIKTNLCQAPNFLHSIAYFIQNGSEEVIHFAAQVIQHISLQPALEVKAALFEHEIAMVLCCVLGTVCKATTLDSIIRALRNLSDHSSKMKQSICVSPTALSLLVGLLNYHSQSPLRWQIVVNAGKVLSNLAVVISQDSFLRAKIRNAGCYQNLGEHLELEMEQYKEIIKNACRILFHLSTSNNIHDHIAMLRSKIPLKLKSLATARHQMIADLAGDTLKNLSQAPNFAVN